MITDFVAKKGDSDRLWPSPLGKFVLTIGTTFPLGQDKIYSWFNCDSKGAKGLYSKQKTVLGILEELQKTCWQYRGERLSTSQVEQAVSQMQKSLEHLRTRPINISDLRNSKKASPALLPSSNLGSSMLLESAGHFMKGLADGLPVVAPEDWVLSTPETQNAGRALFQELQRLLHPTLRSLPSTEQNDSKSQRGKDLSKGVVGGATAHTHGEYSSAWHTRGVHLNSHHLQAPFNHEDDPQTSQTPSSGSSQSFYDTVPATAPPDSACHLSSHFRQQHSNPATNLLSHHHVSEDDKPPAYTPYTG